MYCIDFPLCNNGLLVVSLLQCSGLDGNSSLGYSVEAEMRLLSVDGSPASDADSADKSELYLAEDTGALPGCSHGAAAGCYTTKQTNTGESDPTITCYLLKD